VNGYKIETKKDERKTLVLTKRLCRGRVELTSSYAIKEAIETEGSHPYASCGTVDVWNGRCSGGLVVIKSLRICLSQCEMGSGVVKGSGRAGPEVRRLK